MKHPCFSHTTGGANIALVHIYFSAARDIYFATAPNIYFSTARNIYLATARDIFLLQRDNRVNEGASHLQQEVQI